MKVGVVGAGYIGQKRASVLREFPDVELVALADVDLQRAHQLAQQHNCRATSDWRELVACEQIDIVVVSTPNKFLMPITVAALERGKHVLCEKPLGRNVAEAKRMVEAARANHVRLKTGFNHRHHPAIWKAHELCASGAIGPLMFIRAVYGHGGRPGYDKEWRGDPDLAGGGELLDQGVHIVDLCHWFMGEFSQVSGFTATYFWDLGYFEATGSNPQSPISNFQLPTSNLQLEDNAFALLRTSSGQIATLHTSWTQWKNRFTFEVSGRDGYVIVDGLGGNYGLERLTFGRRRPESGPPIEEHFEFSGLDRSWHDEWAEFMAAVQEQREPLANGMDGLQAMRIIDAIYESARTGQVISLETGNREIEKGKM